MQWIKEAPRPGTGDGSGLPPTPSPRPRGRARRLALGGALALVLVIGAAGSGLAYLDSGIALPPERVMVPDEEERVAYRALPRNLVNAILVAEDRWFYRHDGFSWYWPSDDVADSRRDDAESPPPATITQQLVRMTYDLDPSPWPRMAQEFRLVRQIEAQLTKAEIFERYVNRLTFADDITGIGKAAQRYFGKSVGDLTLAETALLAGLISDPSALSPERDLPAAQRRANGVLEAMVEAELIGPARARDAQARPARLFKPERIAKPDMDPASSPGAPLRGEPAPLPAVAKAPEPEAPELEASGPEAESAAGGPAAIQEPDAVLETVQAQPMQPVALAPTGEKPLAQTPAGVPALRSPPKAKPRSAGLAEVGPVPSKSAAAGPAPTSPPPTSPPPTSPPPASPPPAIQTNDARSADDPLVGDPVAGDPVAAALPPIDHLVQRKPEGLADWRAASVQPLSSPLIRGRPRVIDTATLGFGGQTVRLVGVRPGVVYFAGAMRAYIAGRVVTCRPYDRSTHVCKVDGYDLSEAVLQNGGARSTRFAPRYLRDAEAKARRRGNGIWRNG